MSNMPPGTRARRFSAVVALVGIGLAGMSACTGGGDATGSDASASGSSGASGSTSSGGSSGAGSSSGDSPHPIQSSADYDKTCAAPGDCVAVVEGDVCAPCGCPTVAIRADARAKFDADRATLRKQCPPPTAGVLCKACQSGIVDCVSGKCAYELCSGECDAGADATGD